MEEFGEILKEKGYDIVCGAVFNENFAVYLTAKNTLIIATRADPVVICNEIVQGKEAAMGIRHYMDHLLSSHILDSKVCDHG